MIAILLAALATPVPAFPADIEMLESERQEIRDVRAAAPRVCRQQPQCMETVERNLHVEIAAARKMWFRTTSTVFDSVKAKCRKLNTFDAGLQADAYLDCVIDATAWPRAKLLALAGLTPRGVTLAGFYAIRPGMQHSDVETVLGDFGELSTQASGYATTIEVFTWRGAHGGTLVISFTNDAVTAKSQAGLR